MKTEVCLFSTQELIDRIKSKEYKVNFGPTLFANFTDKNKLNYLINTLEKIKSKEKEKLDFFNSTIKKQKEIEENKNLLNFYISIQKEFSDKLLFWHSGLNKEIYQPVMLFEPPKIYSYIISEYINIGFYNNEIYFYLVNYDNLSKLKKHYRNKEDIPIEILLKEVYQYPEIDLDIFEPIKGVINIPTKTLIFANYFISEDKNNPLIPVNPDKHKSNFNINNIVGLKNHVKYLTSNNIAHGQTGNMSISFFYKENKILIIKSNLKDLYAFDSNPEEDVIQLYNELQTYKQIGEISCAVWSWEATDLELAKKSTAYKKGEIIEFPINGTQIEYIHYYNTLSEKNEYLIAEIIIK